MRCVCWSVSFEGTDHDENVASGPDHEDDNDELTKDKEDVGDDADEEDDFHHAQNGHGN